MDGFALALVGIGLAAPALAQRPWRNPVLGVSVRTVPATHATVDVEIRNASGEAIELPIVATLWLRPVVKPGDSRPPDASALFSVFDPTVGPAGDDSEGENHLRLPVRGVRRVRVDLTRLNWSLSPPLYVWIPLPLSQVVDYPEYDLELHVVIQGMRWESVWSKPVRIRVGAR